MTTSSFRHEALFYAGDEGFLQATVPFVREGLDAGEPVMVAVPSRRLELLRAELGGDACDVLLTDMEIVGANPGRIISTWRDFVEERAGGAARSRGIGEPVWAGRSQEELVECHRHEALINLAFADADGFWLVCPYDTESLDPEVLEGARCSHPHVDEAGTSRESPGYQGLDVVARPYGAPLRRAPASAQEATVEPSAQAPLRRLVARQGKEAGLETERIEDLMLAVTEIATNSVCHAEATGTFRIWQEPGTLVCEVEDRGLIADPLVGRARPSASAGTGGWGVWLANQVCDFVQVRTSPSGSVVRLHMRIG